MAAQKLLTNLLFLSLATLASLFVFARGAHAATLQLNPPGGTYTQNQEFDIKIDLYLSGESVDGVDAELNFDKSILQVKKITPGSLFHTYPMSTFDNTVGTINISGIAQTGSPITQSGVLATITFAGQAQGDSVVSFNFSAGTTTDSNVAQSTTGSDILESVVNGSYTISSSDSSSGTGGTTDDTTTTTTDQSTGLPVTGTVEQTLALLLGGLFFTSFGVVCLKWKGVSSS